VEVLHSVAHDISVAAEWRWREDAFSRVLYESANAIEQGNYLATDGGCSSNSSENKWNRESCNNRIAKRLMRNILQEVYWMGQLNSSCLLSDGSINRNFLRGLSKMFLFLNLFIEENT